VIATYRHLAPEPSDCDSGPPLDATHIYWHSSAQFHRWRAQTSAYAQHACGSGKTSEQLRRAGVQNLRVFPQVALWRLWLGL